jgi:hypothetical protein
LSQEEELLELSTVVAGQRARIEAMEELILDWNWLMGNRFSYTWNNGEGLLIQERIRELGIVSKEHKP